MEEHITYLYNYINSKIKNTDDSKDVLQDVLLYLYKKDITDILNLKGYMINCSNFYILNFFKRKKRTVNFLNEYKNEITSTNIELDIPNSIYLIPIKLQLNGYSIKEISTILNINENTTKTRLRRGKAKLKKYLIS